MLKYRDIIEHDKDTISKMIVEMLGNENPIEIAKEIVEGFYSTDQIKTIVVENQKELIGFSVANLNPFEGAPNIAEIVWHFTSKAKRKNGFGMNLLNRMEGYLKENGIRKNYIKTSVQSKDSVCFWIKQNYQFEARMKDFTGKGYDDYYMGKNI